MRTASPRLGFDTVVADLCDHLTTIRRTAVSLEDQLASLHSVLRAARHFLDDLPRSSLNGAVPDSAVVAAAPPDPLPRILRIKDVCQRCGLARSTIYHLHRDGQFPRLRRLSTRAVGWLASDVEQWLLTRYPQSAGGDLRRQGSAGNESPDRTRRR